MLPIYVKTAELLYSKLFQAWQSEEALTAAFVACKRGPTFDRTAHGRAVVQQLFQDAWVEAHGGSAPVAVGADQRMVLAALHPLVKGDFNLYTQVAPNLVDCYFDVKTEDLLRTITTLETEFASRTDTPNPFVEKRPKVKVTAATHPAETVRRYAYAVSMAKVASILPQADFPNLSHRVTPFGRTPAFSDSGNFCQLPVPGDRFYIPSPLWHSNLQMAFVSWGSAHENALPHQLLDDGTVLFPELPECCRAFKSESGGSMLQQAMTARRGAFHLWGIWAENLATEPCVILPRVNSVQIVGTPELLALVEARVSTPENQQWLTFTRDSRPEILKD